MLWGLFGYNFVHSVTKLKRTKKKQLNDEQTDLCFAYSLLCAKNLQKKQFNVFYELLYAELDLSSLLTKHKISLSIGTMLNVQIIEFMVSTHLDKCWPTALFENSKTKKSHSVLTWAMSCRGPNLSRILQQKETQATINMNTDSKIESCALCILVSFCRDSVSFKDHLEKETQKEVRCVLL